MRSLFRSFVQAGLECSTHKLRDGRRLDVLGATQHDQFASNDFSLLSRLKIHTVRTAVRWHLVEKTDGTYDFRSLESSFSASQRHGVELLVDLLHFGWPDDVDTFDASFVPRFCRFVRAVARYAKQWPSVLTTFAPINEISFLSWAGGDVAAFNPFEHGRGPDLKRALVAAYIAASEILLNELPDVRLLSPEPVIHIIGSVNTPAEEAERYRLSQFETWDMLCGNIAPELGGRPEYLDIIGTNFYDTNQWVHNGETLRLGDPRYRPFHQILCEVWQRYKRPMVVSETGTEGDARPLWFRYVTQEVMTAMRLGVPIHGICLYPIFNHPGWDDNRHCQNGLFDYADDKGNRLPFQPLLEEVVSFQERLFPGTNSL